MFHVAGHRLNGDSRPKKSLKREQGSVVITGSAEKQWMLDHVKDQVKGIMSGKMKPFSEVTRTLTLSLK